MHRLSLSLLAAAALLSLPGTAIAASQEALQYYTTSAELFRDDPYALFEKRPEDCPPCFNCNLDDFVCHQFANYTKNSGKCHCPPGFGGNDCSDPLCGSLPKGNDRLPRPADNKRCECDEGWGGINCNVCQTDDACSALMPEGEGGICYKDGVVVKENYQMCDITNRKILDILKEQVPQATFSCNAEREECNFQFWVDARESFYCGLDTCNWEMENTPDRNVTKYKCENIKCRCIPGRMLCGENGSVDIGEFLEEEIRGPATFSSISTEGGSPQDGSIFSEPNMNELISSVFGDESITLNCRPGECLYKTEVPGYERPIKKINTPLIAGVIAGCALFVVAVILIVFFFARRRSQWGPIHLSEDDEEESAKLLGDHKAASLYFENISYSLKGKQILKGITGAVHPGELLAIMGASGAGKTTFLDILARKNKRGTIGGASYLNGEQVSDQDFRGVIGFVDQDDTMLPMLTIHETIVDSALLRLPKDMSYAAKMQSVEDVEKQLGIFNIRHQTIGNDETRGISGGEKRRVSIACELVTSPSILFLDEPTSGLDAFNAFNVIECLVNLVKTYNRTVVFTIHQPRSNIVALFDQLVLLAQGQTVYSGPFDKCQSYFDSIGYECPPGYNIADYLVDLTMHAGIPHTPIREDDIMFGGDEESEGRATRASSAIAVKSLPSISNMSLRTNGSAAESIQRPKFNKKSSIRQQQERQLFTRKNTQEDTTKTPTSIHSVDTLGEPAEGENRQQWLKLAKQTGRQARPHTDEDPDNVPSTAGEETGTKLDHIVAVFAASDIASKGWKNSESL